MEDLAQIVKCLDEDSWTTDSMGRIIINNEDLLQHIQGAGGIPTNALDFLTDVGCSNSACA